MEFWDQCAVLLAGLGAGIISSSIGVASLISFPVLVAVGLPPVVANASNTIGLVPAGVGGAIGYRRELAAHRSLIKTVVATTAVGAVAGAILLLAFPAGVFELLVPWLILFGCLLVGIQPFVSRWLAARATWLGVERPNREEMSPIVRFWSSIVGVYGGYFGAGQGVMLVAVLAFGLDIEMKVVNALKTIAIFAANVVATCIFVVAAEIRWDAVLLIGLGSVGGGYLGALIGRVLPANVFRVLVVIVGVTVALRMM